jgi:hypothetical protein
MLIRETPEEAALTEAASFSLKCISAKLLGKSAGYGESFEALNKVILQ